MFLLILLAASASCDRDSEPGPEPEDPNVLVAQVVAVSATPEPESANWLNQSLAPLDDGGFAVVWKRGDSWSDIVMQWLDAGGKPRRAAGPLRVTSYPADAGDSVVIGREGGGAFVAFFQLDHSRFQVKVQAFDRDMAPLWPEPMPAIIPSGYELQSTPSLAPAPEGGVFVSFHFYSEMGDSRIRCQRIDAGGARAWGNEGILLSRVNGFVSYPIAVADSLGGVYVFWLNLGNGDAFPPEGARIEGQHLDASGNKLWGNAPLAIARLGDDAQEGYSLIDFLAVPDGRGGAIVSWNGDLDPGDYQIDTLAQRVNGAGQLLWGEGVPAGGSDQNCKLERLVSSLDGGAFVAYVVYAGGSAKTRLHVQRLGLRGKRLWGDGGIAIANTNESNENNFVYGCFAGGQLSLAWARQEFIENSDAYVVACRFKKDGTAMDPPEGVMLDDTRGEQATQGICYDPVSQTAFVLWVDYMGHGGSDDTDLYGAILRKASAAAAASPPFPVSVPMRKPEGVGLKRNGPMPGQRFVRREELAARLKAGRSAH